MRNPSRLLRPTLSGRSLGGSLLLFLTVFATSSITSSPVSATTVTLGSKQDAWIDAKSTTQNKATDVVLRVRSSGPARRALVQFDLSSVPAGSCVSSAALNLKLTTAGTASRSYEVHRLSAPWSEGGATWNNRQASTPWALAGGDIAPSSSVVQTGKVKGVVVSWDVSADVQAFVNGTQNNGWLVKDAVETGTAYEFQFASEENTTGTARPQLVVSYAPCVPPTPTFSPTAVPTSTWTPRPTNTATAVPSNTATAVRTNTATLAPTSTWTPLPTNAATATATKSSTPLPTNTPTRTATTVPTNTTAIAPTNTWTPLPTSTATAVPSSTATATRTNTAVVAPTNTWTPLPTNTLVATSTATLTSTRMPTATPTATGVPLTSGPVLLGFLPGTGDAQDVTVAGGYAFVASNPFGLSVADVSSISSASVVGVSNVPFIGISVAANGARVALMENVGGSLAQLRVLDVTNTRYPVVTGTMPTGIPINNSATGYMGVALNSSGTMAVMAMGAAGVWIASLTNPAFPVHVGTYLTPSTAYAVALNSTGTLAYVATDSGLQIINLALCQPPFLTCAPTFAGGLSTSGTSVGIALSGTMVYLANQNHALYAVDVTNPQVPILKAGVPLSGAGRLLAVDGNRIAVLSNGTTADYLDMVDITTPSSPTQAGSAVLGPPGTAKGVDLSGGLVYIAGNGNGVKVYSPGSAMATPTSQGTIDDTYAARAISVTTGLAAVSGVDIATNYIRLKVLNVMDPVHPAVLGELPTTVANLNATGYPGVAVNSAGTMAVMAMGGNGLWVVNLTDPVVPRQAGSFATSSAANAVALNSAGTLAYVAVNSGMQIVNLAQCQPPFTSCALSLTGALSTPGTDVGIAVSGTTAFLANQNRALYAVSVATPALPVLKAGVGLSGSGRVVAVSGNRAAVISNGTSADYVDIIDITTPTAPAWRAAAPLGSPGIGKGVDVVNSTVYVAANTKQLMIYDITLPTVPVLVGSGYTVGNAFDVRVLGTIAYVADSPATVSIVGLR